MLLLLLLLWFRADELFRVICAWSFPCMVLALNNEIERKREQERESAKVGAFAIAAKSSAVFLHSAAVVSPEQT